jgi:hypothetical protein
MNGWVKDYRSLWDHPLFADEPLTEREAWRWLCSFARHEPGLTRFKSSVIELDRGQLIGSRGRLAREWRWTERKVRTFLKLLQSQDMITLESDQGVTKLTVCNYDLFQGERPDTDQQATSKRPAGGQQVTTNKNGKKEKNEKKRKNSAPVGADRFEEFWKAYPIKADKPNARKAWLTALEKATADEIIEGLERYKAWRDAKGDRAPSIKYAQGWLNGERWNDELDGDQSGGSDGSQMTKEEAMRLIEQHEQQQLEGFH